MRTAVVLATFLITECLFGQYAGGAARDVRDAVRILQDAQRAIEPAIVAVRDQAAVLRMLSEAELELKEAQPVSSFDNAEKTINEFLRRRGEADPGISRDLERTIVAARQILATERPIQNVKEARERLHHEVIHPLQREAMRNAGDLQGLMQQLQFMQGRFIGQILPDVLSATSSASTDPR